MVQRVKQYVEKYHMLEQGDAVVVGVSGGADSVCLLFALSQLKEEYNLKLLVVHVNHGLRIDATKDALYVEELCKKLSIPFFLIEANVKELAKEQGISEEEAGRKLRYDSFIQILKKEAPKEWEMGKGKIAVAHHLNDRAETMLFHLFRGTGIQGLMGIRPVRNEIIRPLLCLTREEIEEWLKEQSVFYCIDSTNEEDTYTRNKIRHHILPYAREEISKRALEHMGNTAEILEEMWEYVKEMERITLQECLEEKEEDKLVIVLSRLKKQPAMMQKKVIMTCLEELIPGRKDIGSVHIQSILELFTKTGSRKINLPGGYIAKLQYDRLILQKEIENKSNKTLEQTEDETKNEIFYVPHEEEFQDGKCWSYPLEGLGIVEISTINRNFCEKIPEKKYTKWFDYDKMKKSVVFRKRKQGDYLTINAACQKKTLKEFLIQEKVPKEERNHIWVLTEDSHILWVMGYRISEFYKIDENTKHILQVQLRGGT